MNILLTGGAGFIGSHVMCFLAKKYSQQKYTIVCIDKLDYCGTTKNFEELQSLSNFVFVKGDITSSDLINHILHHYKIDAVLHFAASTHVDNSFGNSLTFTQNNILGTHVLLESCKNYGKIKKFVHVSTDEVYGESLNDELFHENSLLTPTNPYAATKAGAEFLVKSYYLSFKLPVIITRGNNVFGPKQYPEKLIPKFIQLLLHNQKCCIHGDGQNKRSFIFIDDVVSAFDIILHSGKIGEVYNIGTDFEITNLATTKTILEMMGKSGDQIEFVEDRQFNDKRYFIDISKLNNLGWRQETDFQQGLRKTVEWYQSNRNYFDNVVNALLPHPVQN